jgi:hypothetical protein
MIHLITILISLLGYGSVEDFTHLSEDQIQTEINSIQSDEDGRGGDWELPTYH